MTGDTSRGHKALLLTDGAEREALIGALSGVLDYARWRAAGVDADPETTVHVFRKSVRRARSLVRFSEPLMSRKKARKLHRPLKAAFEPTSALRDGDVLGPVLKEFLGSRPDLAEAGQAVLDRIDGERSERRSASTAAEVLAASVEELDGVEARFAKALGSEVGPADLRHALAVRYGAVQRRRADAASSDDLELVHEWRKRTKELRYSLELLSARLDSNGLAAHAATADLAGALGKLADRLALRAYVGDSVLIDALTDALNDGREAVLAQTEALFAPSPAEFAACVRPPTA
jgi:CHAD domain-containing protein